MVRRKDKGFRRKTQGIKMNIAIIQPQRNPKTLTLKLKCESSKDASGLRMILAEVLREYKYKKKDFEFKITKGG